MSVGFRTSTNVAVFYFSSLFEGLVQPLGVVDHVVVKSCDNCALVFENYRIIKFTCV